MENTSSEHRNMSWLKKIAFSEEDKFSGNCGMYAIALGKLAQEQGKQVVIVIASNAENEQELWGDVYIYHVAVEIDGTIYDGQGKVSVDNIAQFAYDAYGDSNPHIFYLYLDESTISLIRQQTDWDTSWEQYYEMLKKKI